MLKVGFGQQKPTCNTRVIHLDYYARAALAWMKRNVHFEMRNLKQTELQRLKNRGKKAEDKM